MNERRAMRLSIETFRRVESLAPFIARAFERCWQALSQARQKNR
ncbi:hypothetical protein BRPE64_DCDS02230 (plasmid) [Caballeronia insecticola]|uniref:Uncharacterized protein n=1 Tax=Caballeronia insecticola TaxID=758793 RepID=R4WRF8_9BURK|nr:hypothetical protein BRPE64_DCDS02230 [Caballeronia insecticola]